MGHQVIITFDIDENKVQENAEKEAGRQIAKTVIDKTFGSSYYVDVKMKNYVTEIIEDLIKPHKDEIISEAIKNVTDGFNRSKIVREKLQEALDESKG